VTVAIVDYGMGNLRSVSRAIAHVGGSAEVTSDPAVVAAADAVVVPGVGRFGACMRNLIERGLDAAVKDATGSGRPVIGVCLGLQVLMDTSEEDEDAGLGIVRGRSRRLPDDVKVPHMGWNTVRWTARHPFVTGLPTESRFYFVHSYAADVDAYTTVGVTEHGRPFASVVARDNVFATQFHPEKSGEAGLSIYEAFVREART
jgi:imidazole glycerol-phosphate synthase subunit HisH